MTSTRTSGCRWANPKPKPKPYPNPNPNPNPNPKSNPKPNLKPNLNPNPIEVTSQGRVKKLKSFLRWCYTGPPLARADSVSVAWEEV